MNDFDFFAGRWNVTSRRLIKPLSGSDEWEEFPGFTVATRHFDGAASVDEIVFPTKGFSGMTVRVYDERAGQWAIYWANSATGRLDTSAMVGGFEGDRGEFHGEESVAGRRVRCRFVWTVPGAGAARWEQAFSGDGGRTWETNWTMDFSRA
ncbi:hypothetical protein [Nonomuraea salmonea]|jgi:hypothetical protein|uniref:DUF1579 domain-containing protein n=1 Tax=Nonomuraea salmonea TaxID=46181 RepID=A0ABV5NST0_9ACTN